MSLNETKTKFALLENDLLLFELKIKGVYIWDYIRLYVYLDILEQSGIYGKPQAAVKPTSNLRKMLLNSVKHSFSKNPLLGKSDKDVLVFGLQRRKRLWDNKYWDIYTDHLLEELPFSFLAIEEFYMGYRHMTPAKNPDLNYLDFLHLISFPCKLLPMKLNESEERAINRITNRIKEDFGVNLKLKNKILFALKERLRYVWILEKLLAKYKPKLIVEGCHYASFATMTMNELCKEKGIPTVELQHGIVDKNHLSYSFPKLNREVVVFPDYLFIWGNYWKKFTDFPIPPDRVVVTGYPHYEYMKKIVTKNKKKHQIVFLSQNTVGEKLSKLALDFVRQDTNNYKVVYKLHPNEYLTWETDYPELQASKDITVIKDDSVSLYALLKESGLQVGVASTTLFEGLGLGVEKTFILDAVGWELVEPLITEGYVIRIKSAKDLIQKIGKKTKNINEQYFFKKNSVENIIREMEKILGQPEASQYS